MYKLSFIPVLFVLVAPVAFAQEKLSPPRDNDGTFVMDGPFRGEILGFWDAQSKATIERDKKNDVKLTAQARLYDKAGQAITRTMTAVFKNNMSCFDNPIPRNMNYKEKIVVIEYPACGGNGMPEQYYILDFASGKMEKQNALQAQRNGLSLKPLYANDVAKYRSQDNTGWIDLSVNRSDLIAIVLPEDTSKFFSRNESRILTKDHTGNLVIIKGRFTGNKANGRWAGDAEGLQVAITTKLTGNQEGMPNGTADFVKNGEKFKITWSMPDAAIQF